MSPKSSSALPFTRRFALGASLATFASLPFAAGACEEAAAFGQAFRHAVEGGDLERVRAYLDRDPSLMWSRDERGRSVAVLALLAGHPEVVALFRERGLTLDLVEAVMASDLGRVEALLDAAPGQVSQLHPFGGDAMHAAAIVGYGERMFVLQGYGGDANSNPPGGSGMTPLRIAFDGRDPFKVEATVASLLGNGADPNAPQKEGESALHAAVRIKNSYLVRMLLRKGADTEAKNLLGQKPLDLAEALGETESVALLRHPEKVTRDHRTSRFAANAGGGAYDPPAIDLPVRQVNQFVGAAHGNLEKVREWVGRKPELAFAISSQGEMAVEGSAHVGHQALVHFLLERGVPQSLPTSIIAGDLTRAGKLLEEDPLRIHERGPHDFPLSYYPSFAGGSLEAAQLLLDKGLDVEAERSGATALHLAARQGHRELAELWLQHGADPGAKTRGEKAMTALEVARERGQESVASLLEKI